MSKNSLSYNDVTNQQASWIDDPFELGSTFKGMTNISNETRLFNFVDQLVSTYAKYDGYNYLLFVSDLPESEQNELVRLYIEYTDREISDCVHGDDFSINNDYTCALLAMLKNDSKENRERFAETVRKNTITFFEKSLDNLLQEACNSFLFNSYEESGYRQSQDDCGEPYWTKNR